ncbi:hypothetical protein Rahaq_5080 (plasmid) [Rahnella aceris]|uniref:Uncharacterized protein n=1 Tax=Rahnella sp. (strain Y9602) TaxID=2703885 RepID=A0A0H3FP63_RAHSY|nr:hypothetical protein [Rahnella aceris]ADW76653.1 hypothetical protein Rahaq_5080 [Rahnella aceris]
MVKRRERPVQLADAEKIEAFAAQAESKPIQKPVLSKDAKRDFKAIRVPFNEYEFTQLEALCEKTQRSKLNMIRHALSFYAENGFSE